jgi:tRNA pseudouridine65 synthase
MSSEKGRSVPLVTAPPGPLPLLYRDDVLVIVNKPSGLSAHRGMSNEQDYVLTRARTQLDQRVYLVHRLDRATSGAMAMVLDPAHVAPVQRAFEEKLVRKRYLALTRGVMPEHVLVDCALPRGEDPKGERVPAITEFTRLGVYADRYSLVEAVPSTGRFHQIRRHLAHLRHPIIGDTNYGDRKENKLFRERFSLLRLALHASDLHLPHPVLGSEVRVSAALPDDLAGPLAAMGLLLSGQASLASTATSEPVP